MKCFNYHEIITVRAVTLKDEFLSRLKLKVLHAMKFQSTVQVTIENLSH